MAQHRDNGRVVTHYDDWPATPYEDLSAEPLAAADVIFEYFSTVTLGASSGGAEPDGVDSAETGEPARGD